MCCHHMSAWAVRMTNSGIAWPDVLYIRSVVGVTHWGVELPVWIDVHKTDGRSYEGCVERPVHKVWVPNVDKARVIGVMTISVVVQHKAAHSIQPSVAITDLHITDLAYTTIPIVENRNIFHLDHRAIIVILYKRAVVVARVESGVHVAVTHRCGSPIRKIEIEFSIGVNRKGYSHLIEHDGICITVDVRIPVGIGCSSHGQKTSEYQHELFHDFQFFGLNNCGLSLTAFQVFTQDNAKLQYQEILSTK